MKILLVSPPFRTQFEANNPRVIDRERGKNPPLGILYVASAIRKEDRHEAQVLDGNLTDWGHGEFKEFFKASGCDVLGVTITTFTLLDSLEVIRAFREVMPGGKVIAGGPHVAIYPQETVGLGLVDVAVKREGEPVINDILDRIDRPEALNEVKGICFRLGNEIIDTGQASYIDDLDSLAPPDRSLLPYKQYYSLLGGAQYSTTMFTSRGCPFRCGFCDRPALGKRFRCHSARYVVDEIRRCVDLGIREFLFYDDTFTVHRRRVLDICQGIVQNGFDISWDIRTRIDTVDEEMLRALKRAGCSAVHYGVEAGSQRVLERLNKCITIDRAKEIFRLTTAIGMDTLAYFMIGNPGETIEDIRETLDLALEIQPDFLHLTIFTPFPATRLYQEALEAGIIENDVWREFAADPKPDFGPPIWAENFSRDELQEIIARSYKRFYLRPQYAVKRLLRVRSFAEFKRKARAGLSVLKMKRS